MGWEGCRWRVGWLGGVFCLWRVRWLGEAVFFFFCFDGAQVESSLDCFFCLALLQSRKWGKGVCFDDSRFGTLLVRSVPKKSRTNGRIQFDFADQTSMLSKPLKLNLHLLTRFDATAEQNLSPVGKHHPQLPHLHDATPSIPSPKHHTFTQTLLRRARNHASTTPLTKEILPSGYPYAPAHPPAPPPRYTDQIMAQPPSITQHQP